jgi:glycosyltransferase involved in cell wall biosynthesis
MTFIAALQTPPRTTDAPEVASAASDLAPSSGTSRADVLVSIAPTRVTSASHGGRRRTYRFLALRILLVNAEGAATSAGGAETIVAMLARGLAARGWEVEVLAAFPTDDPPEERRVVTLHGTSWRTSERRRILNHLGDLAAAPTPRLGRAVRAARPDVVHTHNLPGLSTAVWGAAAAAGARVVHTLHDYYLLCPRVTLVAPSGEPCGRGAFCGFRSRRLRRWSHAVDEVVGVSESLLARHEGFFSRAREHVIRHPRPGPVRAASPPASPPPPA